MINGKLDFLTLTQAETGEKAIVLIHQIFGALKLKENKATGLIGPGGATIYVKETIEQIEVLLNKAGQPVPEKQGED